MLITSADRHQCLTQLYRWYQYYENPLIPISNQLDLFTDTVEFNTPNGFAKGKDAYINRVQMLPKTWQNSHHVQSVDYARIDDRTLMLKLNIIYQNIGMKPDKALTVYGIDYELHLTETKEHLLPKISYLQLTPNNQVVPDHYQTNFIPAYLDNRLKSLVHYWFYLMDSPQLNTPTKLETQFFQEILSTNNLSLTLGDSIATSYTEFSTIIQSKRTLMGFGEHEFSHLNITHSPEAPKLSLIVTFTTPTNSLQTQHAWTIEDKPSERFARIQNLTVKRI